MTDGTTDLVVAAVLLALALTLVLWQRDTESAPAPSSPPSSAPEPDDLAGRGRDSIPVSDLSFTIGSTVTGRLSPGASRPLNLSIHNRTPSELSVTRLTVAVGSVDAPNADGDHPCDVADFDVQQLAAAFPVTVPAGRTTDLAELGVPSAEWPHLEMINTPQNQNGCKGATLRLSYDGSAERSAS